MKNSNRFFFVGGVFLVALIIGVGVYYSGSSDLLQGRMFNYFRSSQVISKASNSIISPYCLTPAELEKKQQESFGNVDAGKHDDEDKKTGEPPLLGDKSEDSGEVVIKSPGLISGGTGANGGIIEGVGSSGGTIVKEPKYNYVQCDCKDDGKEWYTVGANSESVLNICSVDKLKCLKPDLKCPRGKVLDDYALATACRKGVDKYCSGAAKANSDFIKLCEAKFPAEISFMCPEKNECEKYKQLFSMGVYTSTIMAQEGISKSEADNKVKACKALYGTKGLEGSGPK